MSAVMLLPGTNGSLLLVQRTVTRIIVLQETIGKGKFPVHLAAALYGAYLLGKMAILAGNCSCLDSLTAYKARYVSGLSLTGALVEGSLWKTVKLKPELPWRIQDARDARVMEQLPVTYDYLSYMPWAFENSSCDNALSNCEQRVEYDEVFIFPSGD
ncbi:hypothetical protein STEG23_033008 [Scotinomys teguina]